MKEVEKEVKKNDVKKNEVEKNDVKKNNMKKNDVEKNDVNKNELKETELKEIEVKEDERKAEVGKVEVKKNDESKNVLQVVENVEETCWEAVLPSSWGSSLPASTPCTNTLTPIWRPWESKEKLAGPRKPGPGRRKRRSPAAEARSQRRLLEWQHRVDSLREVNRLHREQRIMSTPVPTPQEVRRVCLIDRLDRVKGVESGTQTLPSTQYRFGGEGGEILGSLGEGQGLQASGFKNFSSLQQIPNTTMAESSFPTPPPPPSWSSKWRGDWWLVPAGMSTQCASCHLWGPLTPGG